MVHINEPSKMKLNFAKYLIILLLLASCGNQKKEIKEYGFKLKDSDSLNVSIRISEFDNYENFLDRLKEIVCYDSIPNIVIESENQVRNIYPIEYSEIPMFHPRFRNTFFIRMDSIVKNERKVEISELSALMKQNYENMGVKQREISITRCSCKGTSRFSSGIAMGRRPRSAARP